MKWDPSKVEMRAETAIPGLEVRAAEAPGVVCAAIW